MCFIYTCLGGWIDVLHQHKWEDHRTLNMPNLTSLKKLQDTNMPNLLLLQSGLEIHPLGLLCVANLASRQSIISQHQKQTNTIMNLLENVTKRCTNSPTKYKFSPEGSGKTKKYPGAMIMIL